MSENLLANHAGRGARIIGHAAWVYVGLNLAALITVLVIRQLPFDSQTYFLKQAAGQLQLNALIYLLALVIVVYAPYVVVKKWKKTHPESLKALLGLKNTFRWKHLGFLALAFAGYFFTSIVLSSLATLLPWYNAEQVQDVGFQGISTPLELSLAFVALVILPPIAEELLFRGYYFGKLRRENGFWISAIFTSILFGIIHGQWNVGVDTFALSIFLCLLREKTGSIWMSIGLHGLKNGIAYFFLFIAPLLGIQLQ